MKILTIRLGCAGDMILTTPLFAAVKEKFPDAEIDVIAGRRNYSILTNNPRVRNIIVNDKSPLKIPRTLARIRREKYDYYIDCRDHNSRESRLFAKIVKAGAKIGFNAPGKKRLFDFDIPSDIENYNRHFVERVYKCLKPLGIEAPDEISRPQLFHAAESIMKAEIFFESLSDKPVIALNLSAGTRDRIYPAELWLKALQAMDWKRFAYLLFYMPAQRGDARSLLEYFPELREFKARSLDEVAAALKICDMLITPDTSLVHVASAYDLPIVELAPNDDKTFRKFYPLSRRNIVIMPPFADDPLSKIKPEQIALAANTIAAKI